MPHGYIDPVQRVHQQQALRSLARPAQNIQQPVYQQPIQSPLAGLPQAQSEVIRASGLGQHRRPSPEATVFWGMLGALVGYLIHKNWHRAWVRGVTTFTGTFIGGWIVTFIGTAIVAALVDQNNNGTDTGPSSGARRSGASTASRRWGTPGRSATSSRRGANPMHGPIERHYQQIRAETEARARRMAERVAEQERLHGADPERHSLMIPVDDDEFPDESYTAGWQQEEGA
jgi:hypothetical protein